MTESVDSVDLTTSVSGPRRLTVPSEEVIDASLVRELFVGIVGSAIKELFVVTVVIGVFVVTDVIEVTGVFGVTVVTVVTGVTVVMAVSVVTAVFVVTVVTESLTGTLT